MDSNDTLTQHATGPRYFLRALRARNYRLFFVGQGISLIGSWMPRVATSWLVYRLTGSVFLLGIVGFAGQIPTFLLAPFAGVLVDRWNRHRILVITQILAMFQSFALAILALRHMITVEEVVLLSILQGIVNAFDIPARQAFVVEMVEDKEDLSNAIALNSSLFNGARLVGPSIAGVLIASAGEGICFLIDGLSYLAVIAALLAMTLRPSPTRTDHPPVWQELTDGMRYASHLSPIKAVLLLVALLSLAGMPYTVLIPVFAREILHGGAHTFGFLMGASGMGALIGAMYLASRKTVLGLGRIIAMAAALFGIGLIALASSKLTWVAIALTLVVGFGMLVQMAASNTVLQTLVDDDKRGRVMSFYAMAFMGMTPFGSLVAGALASRIGVPDTLRMSGAVCVLGALAFACELPTLRAVIRPIYVKRGILPEIAAGVQAATQLSMPPED